MSAFLCMEGISKRFGAVVALHNVSLQASRGAVHALIGENGAGKSTLMKILSGSLMPDTGRMSLNHQSYAPRQPKDARMAGVSMIYQELTLAPHLTVEENVTLGVERQKNGVLLHQDAQVREALALLGHEDIDPKTPVKSLGIGKQQIVEIARSLLLQSQLIVMDEPTSSLSAEDTQNLFAAIKRLRDQGVTIIYISHFLEEIEEIADEYTVLRDGATICSGLIAETTQAAIVTNMVGRSLEEMFPRTMHSIGEPLLQADHLTKPPRLQSASIRLHRGEILGIAGLVGSGRSEFLRGLFGLDHLRAGSIHVAGHTIAIGENHSPAKSLSLGMSMVSENRKEEGLAVNRPILDNISYSSLRQFVRPLGRIDLKNEAKRVIEHAQRVALKYHRISDPVASLSGGNQQKTALARLFADGSTILLLDEPTRGIDVRSKVEIYRLIGELAAAGKGIVWVSSYLPELIGICDSLAVMFRGKLSPTLPIDHWTEERVMSWATTGK